MIVWSYIYSHNNLVQLDLSINWYKLFIYTFSERVSVAVRKCQSGWASVVGSKCRDEPQLGEQLSGEQLSVSNCRVSNCRVSNWRVSNWRVSNWRVSNCRWATVGWATVGWATVGWATVGWAIVVVSKCRVSNCRGEQVSGEQVSRWASVVVSNWRWASVWWATDGWATVSEPVEPTPICYKLDFLQSTNIMTRSFPSTLQSGEVKSMWYITWIFDWSTLIWEGVVWYTLFL